MMCKSDTKTYTKVCAKSLVLLRADLYYFQYDRIYFELCDVPEILNIKERIKSL